MTTRMGASEVTHVAIDGAASATGMRGRHRDYLTLAAFAWLAVVAVVAVTGTLLAPYDYTGVELSRRLIPPFSHDGEDFFLLGTDELGRDYLSRVIAGTRASIGLGLIGALLATTAGLLVGSFSGYLAGRTDAVVARAIDLQMAFPGLLFILLIVVAVGPGIGTLIIVLAFVGWPGIARMTRGLALQIRREAYIDSARALDASTLHIVRRHVQPNLLAPVLILGSILVAHLMLASATLDFLGLGLQPPDVSWGLLIATGRDSVQSAPWLIAIPGIAIFVTALAINVSATHLRGVLEKRGYSIRRPRRQIKTSLDARSGDSLGDHGQVAITDLVLDGIEDIPLAAPMEATSVDVPTGDSPTVDPSSVLAVVNLSVDFPTESGIAHVVRGVSFTVGPGEVMAIVGESGSGKSVTARAVMGILEPSAVVTSGRIVLEGASLLELKADQRRRLNGRRLAMVQQDATAALNPVKTVGGHLEETLRIGDATRSRQQIRSRSIELLEQVGIADPVRRYNQYPFQLSGGMSQRVLIAMAVANNPRVLVADEPTTALDVTYQAQIMDLLLELRAMYDMSLVLITHDLALVAERADRVVVMYAGMVMEQGMTSDVVHQSANPYTRALLRARPTSAVGRLPLTPVPGSPPRPTRLPAGCAFAPRCSLAGDVCRTNVPALEDLSASHSSRCHFADMVWREGPQ